MLVVLCSCVLRLSLVGASESTRPEISLSLRALLGCADWWAVLVSLGGVGIDLPRRAELLSLAFSVALLSAWGVRRSTEDSASDAVPRHGAPCLDRRK